MVIMTELQKIKISVSKSNETIKEIEESHEGSLSSLVLALKNIKNATNEYLTTLVDEEISLIKISKSKSRTIAFAKNLDDNKNEESDLDLEEDFIDSQIKQELTTRHGLGSSLAKRTEKRCRPQNKNNKRLKH